MKSILSFFIFIFTLALFSGCGGGGGGSATLPPPETSINGEVVYGPTQGLTYVCSSGYASKTNSLANFSCNDGDTVSFYLGGTLIALLNAKDDITTPYEFFPNNTTAALNFVRLLQALDSDGNSSYGPIVINTALEALIPPNIDYTSASFANDIETALSVTLISQTEAQIYLNQAILDAGGNIPAGNNVPIANAGIDQSSASANINLDGSLSYDPDGSSLSYLWSIIQKPVGSTTTLSDNSIVNPSFTADLDGTYTFGLVVNDGISDSPIDTVVISISFPLPNLAPIANAGVNQNVKTGLLVSLDASLSTDPENDAMSYSWSILSQPSTVTLTGAGTINPSFTPDLDGTYLIEVSVTDTNTNTSTDTITVVSTTANAAPVALAGPDQSTDVNTLINLDGSSSSDAEGPISTYLWSVISKPADSVAVLLSSANIVNPDFTPDFAGEYIVQLIVNDGSLNSDPDTLTVTAIQTQAIKQTGQTFFTLTGEDGFYQKGAVLDYTLASDIVSDGVTGLMWQDDNPTSYNPISGNSAEAYCASLTLGGFTDWRLPLVEELLSIANRDQFNPATDVSYFRTSANFKQFWSGTVIDASERRLVDFYYGDEASVNSNNSYPVRCVRGSSATSTLQRDAVNGVVIDTQSKLVWQDNTNPSAMQWDEAISYCEALNLNGSSDWRLPNINELLSVVDFENIYSVYKPIFSYKPDNAWSSTTVTGNVSKAFSIYNPSSTIFFFTTYYKAHVSADESKTSSFFSNTRKNPKCVMDLP